MEMIENKLIRIILVICILAVVILGTVMFLMQSGLEGGISFLFGVPLGILLGAIGIEYDRQILKGAESIRLAFRGLSTSEKMLRGFLVITTYGIFIFLIVLMVSGGIDSDTTSIIFTSVSGLLGTIFLFYFPKSVKNKGPVMDDDSGSG